jgi:cell division protein FtsB
MASLPFNVRRVAVIIGIIALVFIVLEFNRRLEELKLLNKQHELVQAQATQAVQTQMALQTQVAYAGSSAAVEEWARTDGHYIQDGDLPVVPIGQPGAAPIELSTPVPTPTPMTNVQIWWDLFFGEH